MKNTNGILFLVFVIGLAIFALDVTAQTEISQQLEGLSSTLDTVGTQAEVVRQKGVFGAIWDSLTAPITQIWRQIAAIWQQIASIFSFAVK